MKIACVMASGRGATDRLLSGVVARLAAGGVRVLGALREDGPGGGSDYCDSALRVLPDGPIVSITQDLGSGSTSCRMDAGALEEAVGLAAAQLSGQGGDLVVLNKFGLSEAEGRGFRAMISDALMQDIPVLIGVTQAHRPAFDRFASGQATELPPDEAAILDWCRAMLGLGPAPASAGETEATETPA